MAELNVLRILRRIVSPDFSSRKTGQLDLPDTTLSRSTDVKPHLAVALSEFAPSACEPIPPPSDILFLPKKPATH
ncbi:hypothetical protein EVAR_87476_1 [Eumeta japonica]|uniref:Uncharacterized protein n=1 Tax=Eumeta variegata TaxID=151549 RepID=A0A4C1VZ81_EUMVA|nr:hypothetical protein EVAR_87476_1 [Eumeta japonica]